MVIVVCVAKNSICVAKNSISDCVWHVRRQVVNMLNKTNLCKDTRPKLQNMAKGQGYKDLDCNFARHRLQGHKDLDCNFARHRPEID